LDLAHAHDWQCAACDHRIHVDAVGPELSSCMICGNGEIYKKKDFPHWLGMTILLTACLLSVITYWLYQPFWTWVILIGSAAFDGILYLSVGDALVCYRCNAHYRGFATKDRHEPFEITIGERYRQERLRREQFSG